MTTQAALQAIRREMANARAALRRKMATGKVSSGGEIATVPPAVAAVAGQEATQARISVASIATHVLVAGASGKRIGVYQLMIYNTAAQDIEFLDGAASIMGPLTAFPANQGMHLPYSGEPHWILGAGQSLSMSTSAADQVSGFIQYRLLEV